MLKLLKKKSKNELTAIEHSRDLKIKILVFGFFFIFVFIASYVFCNYLGDYILEPAVKAGYKLVYLSPQEILVQQLKISGVVAIIIGIPLFAFLVLLFVNPILDNNIILKKGILCELEAIFLFSLGVLFAYKIIFPFALSFLKSVNFNTSVSECVSVASYISFFITIMGCMGIMFEIPLVILTFVKLHILTPELLIKANKPVIVVIFVIAAIITPPDVVSQIIVAIPILGLYWISILFAKIIARKRN